VAYLLIKKHFDMAKYIYTNKRFAFVIMLLSISAIVFWSGSRDPSLDEKAIMGGSATLEDPLSFEATLQAQPGDEMLTRVLYSTINWVETNFEGMAFGLIVGACLLTLISMFPARGHGNGYINSLIGVFIGTPLGVCVNCSAPVAKGMHDGGARLETTLATMLSSPTLNVIVLSMLFSIFPLYIVMIKLVLTLVYIMLFVPWLSTWVFRKERAQSYDDSRCQITPAPIGPDSECWSMAIANASRTLLGNLFYIGARTVPLMFVAGLLGAIVANTLPLSALTDTEPNILSVALIALVGILLPVPVAFDIVIVAVLISAGAPMVYSMTLLFTLGIFSVYPFFIIWNSISPKVAIILMLTLTIMGVIGGAVAEEIHKAELREMLEYLDQEYN